MSERCVDGCGHPSHGALAPEKKVTPGGFPVGLAESIRKEQDKKVTLEEFAASKALPGVVEAITEAAAPLFPPIPEWLKGYRYWGLHSGKWRGSPDQIHWFNADGIMVIEPSSGYEEIGSAIGRLVQSKQVTYGNSYGKCGDFLKLLYPDDIQPEQYGDMLALARVFDKMMRIASGHKDAFEENPWRDIAGYAILGVANDEPKPKEVEHADGTPT